MPYLEQIAFIILLAVTGFFAFRGYKRVYDNIQLGKDEDITPDFAARFKNMTLVAFGQKKMFKRVIPAFLHLMLYVAFLVTQLELLEIIADGVTGDHRALWKLLDGTAIAGLYNGIISTIEILSVLALVATVIFLIRRNALYIPRLRKPELKGWPHLDANLILYGEIVLVVCIMLMNSADAALQDIGVEKYVATPPFAVSSLLAPLWSGMSESSLVALERVGWWGHIIMVFGFLVYLPYSKHLHILFAFPNTYFAKLTPNGEMDNMPDVMHEVKSMMGLVEGAEDMPMDEEIPEFGANDVFDLSWRDVLGAYACTHCGRCTAVCPANLTGKKLSPRKVVMNVRQRAEEIGENIRANKTEYIREDRKETDTRLTKENYDDGKSLFDYITSEELHACTTCNACVEACPVLINPLDPILKMRRYEILTQSAGPADWMPMFTSIENSGSVWQIPDSRAKWTEQLASEPESGE